LCLDRLPLAYAYALNEIESGHSVMVHCRHGKDRTGLFMTYFLRQQLGMSSKDAVDWVKTVRPIALTAEGWEQFAIDVLDACQMPA
jgi:protein-tyrosine phosphatase